MKKHKKNGVAYWGYPTSSPFPTTSCGLTLSADQVTDRWKNVTCKRCLKTRRRKEQR